MNIDMLVFGEDWGEHPSSTQHLITQLLPEQQILWINSLGLRRPRLNSADLRRAWQKVSKMIGQSGQHQGTDSKQLCNSQQPAGTVTDREPAGHLLARQPVSPQPQQSAADPATAAITGRIRTIRPKIATTVDLTALRRGCGGKTKRAGLCLLLLR